MSILWWRQWRTYDADIDDDDGVCDYGDNTGADADYDDAATGGAGNGDYDGETTDDDDIDDDDELTMKL